MPRDCGFLKIEIEASRHRNTMVSATPLMQLESKLSRNMGKDLLFRNPIKVTQDGILFKQNYVSSSTSRKFQHCVKLHTTLRQTFYPSFSLSQTVALVHLLINMMLRCMIQKTFPCHKLSKHAPESNHARVS